LSQNRFIVIGVGGTGGWLSMGLAASIEFTKEIDPKLLILVDGDNFEPKNQERQHFQQLGNKAEVRAAEIQPLYPRTFITPKNAWVVDEVPETEQEGTRVIAASALLEDGDIVFLCVDNFRCRADVVAAAAKIPNIHVFLVGNGGVEDGDEYFGSVYHYQRVDGEDVTANPLEFKPELFDPPDRNPGLMSCQERAALDGGTQIIWTNMAVAAWAGSKVSRLIFSPPEEDDADDWDECMFDLRRGAALPYFRKVGVEEMVPDEELVPAS